MRLISIVINLHYSKPYKILSINQNCGLRDSRGCLRPSGVSVYLQDLLFSCICDFRLSLQISTKQHSTANRIQD